ncbi:hypothetical protein GDO86_014088 [Hymenochirus boettgeri]|uniref:AP-4 complex accessory subunit Tepsin n=1 Tax=Hymenochirus boettgeri TaxID=247094 RepID=A0A8T2JT32_9PIPI|nr:hypothetical protein GDO86_014088 [Hymenochirus boettgeri]
MAMLDRLAFLHKLPLLLKGTSDDDTPCPGYLYEDIAKISHESTGSSQCLLEYLLNRLQANSCQVKLKVLKILLSLCSHGSPQFIQDLRRNVSYIQEAAAVSGPPDPLHGTSLYQKVRVTAQEVVGNLFSDVSSCPSHIMSTKKRSQSGMGSQASHTLQGFGYSQEQKHMGSRDAFLTGIQRAAVAVTHSVLPGAEQSLTHIHDHAGDTYKPVAIPLVERQLPPGKCLPLHANNFRGSHRSGVPGGGWDETDSGNSSQESSNDKSHNSRSSDAGSKSESDHHSGSSQRESSDTNERVEITHLGDCLQEARLVQEVTQGQRTFLTQEEIQQFVRGCSRLNCEVVFELLNCSLLDESTCTKLRCLSAISSLMTSDLLSHDHMLGVIRSNLQKLSEGSPGPVTAKATKILRQFQALTKKSPDRGALNPADSSPPTVHCNLDVLSDVVPHSVGGGLLTPLNVPSSPNSESSAQNPSTLHTDGAVSNNIQNTERNTDEESKGPKSEETSKQNETYKPLSLFEGMELVMPLRCSHKGDQLTHRAIRLSGVLSVEEPSKPAVPSVFSFLNT